MSESISVSISLADSAPKLGNFGTLAFFGRCPYAVDPRTYAASSSGLAAMVADGFAVSDEAYKFVAAVSAQPNAQPSVKVYPRDNGSNDREILITPDNTTEGFVYTITAEGAGGPITATYTVESGDDASDVCAGLVAGLTAQTGGTVTVTDVGDVDYTVHVYGPGGRETFTHTADTQDADQIATALEALIEVSPSFTCTVTTNVVTIFRIDGAAVTFATPTPVPGLVCVAGEGPSTGTYAAATDNEDGTLTIAPAVTGQSFWLSNWSPQLTLNDESGDAGIATDLAAGAVADGDFFSFGIESTAAEEIVAAAAWATSNRKMFVGLTLDTDAGTNSEADVAFLVNDTGTTFAKVWYTVNAGQRQDAALLGRVMGAGPAFGWEFLRLANASPVRLGVTFTGWLDTKAAGYIKTDRGESYTHNTKFPGRYPDLTRGFEWLKDRVIASLLKVQLDSAESGGVLFTDSGLQRYKGALLSESAVAVGEGLLTDTPAPRVEITAVSLVSALDKAARTVNGIKLLAVLAGKVETLNVEIVVTP